MADDIDVWFATISTYAAIAMIMVSKKRAQKNSEDTQKLTKKSKYCQ